MTEVLITSLLASVSTNIDDIFILMLFFGSKKYSSTQIFLGQYLGIAALVIVSYIFAQIGNFIDPRYIGLLGLFPIYLAIRQCISLLKSGAAEDSNVDPDKAGILAVAGVTIANGSDNIGVYVPLFATLSNSQMIMLITVFLIMTFVWCVIGKYLARHPLLAKSIARFGHIVMPIILFLLGVYILFESKAVYLFL